MSRLVLPLSLGACLLAGLIGPPLAAKGPPPPPLFKAVQSGKIDRVKKQLDKGADVNERWHEKRALADAVNQGSLPIVELLLAHGAKADDLDGWPSERLIFKPVRTNNLPMAKLLLAHGADAHDFSQRPDSRAYNDEVSCVWWAVYQGYREMLDLLLANGGKPEDRGDAWKDTPLHIAARRQDAEIAQILLLAGANVDPRNTSGLTPLLEGLYHSNGYSPELLDTVKVLVEAGADVNASTDYVGPSIYHASEFAADGTLQLTQSELELGNYLLSKGASLTQAAAWYTRSSQIRAVDTAEREKHEAARKVAAAEREREEEAEREAARAAAANKKASTGSCTCTRRVSRFVPGREQLRGHYEFYDQSYACPCK